MAPAIPTYSVYGDVNERDTLRVLNVEDIASTNRVHKWTIRPHRHRDLFQILFIKAGGGRVLIDENALHVHAPALIAIPPYAIHGFTLKPSSRGTVLSISEHFRRDLLRVTGELSLMNGLGGATVRELTSRELRDFGVERIFREIVAEAEDISLGRTSLIAAKILEITAALVRLNVQGPRRQPSVKSPLLDAFSELLENNYEKAWCVRDYAAALNTTERTLRRTLRKSVDDSPLNIIHRRKLVEGKRRLIYTESSVSQIAYGLGFGDSSHFTKFFSEQTGMTPITFRQAGAQRLFTSPRHSCPTE